KRGGMGKCRREEFPADSPYIRLHNRYEGRICLDAGIDQRDLNRNKRERLIRDQTEKRYQYRIDRLDKEYLRCSRYIVDDLPAFHHNMWKVRKVGIQKHYLRNLAACVTSVRNCNRAVRLTQCQQVIDSIACHRHLMALTLQRQHKLLLLLRRHSGKNSISPAEHIIIQILDRKS